MKQNPYSTALATLGLVGLILGVVTYFLGANMAGGGFEMMAFSQWAAQFGGLALVGYLLYEAFEWYQLERRRVDAELRRKAAQAKAVDESGA